MAEPAGDPPLSANGRDRAQALREVIDHFRPAAIITSQYRRSIETAQPSAVAFAVTPTQVPVNPQKIDENIAAVAAAVRERAGQRILVVGHNVTVPAVITALGGPDLPPIDDAVYDKLFVLVLDTEARLVEARYGAAASPAVGGD